MTTRERVVEEARCWLGTPYHHRARLLGVGVDCAMLPAEVYERAGLIPRIEPEYSDQWYMHRDEELYLAWVRKYGTEIPREKAGPGDFAIWRFGRTYSHGAIVVDPPVVIHALLRGRAVILDNMDICEDLRTREARFFTFWEN